MPFRTLPEALTSFLGRADEKDRLVELHRSGARLVSLLGPGGIGKTRLARVAAEALERQEPALRTWFCDLSAAADDDSAFALIAAACDAELGELGADQRTDGLVGALDEGPGVLILDNFEHLAPHAETLVGQLVARTEQLSVWVTSRTALGLPGERRFAVNALSLDDAVSLFVDRATLVAGEFDVDDATHEACLRIAQATGGVPLAIELCAGRAGLLSPAQIADRAEADLDLYKDQHGDRPERHQSLRACIQASVDLLSDVERRAFAQCSAFRGGFTVESAEAVLHLDGATVLDALSQLRFRSLVQSQAGADGGPARLYMLPALSAYADELLSDDDRKSVRARHLAHFAEVALALEAATRTADGSAAFRRLVDERENFDRAMAEASDVDPGAGVLCGAALHPLAMARGPFDVAFRYYQLALDLAQQSGDDALVGAVTFWRGEARRATHDFSGAREDLDLAVAAFERAQSDWSPAAERLGARRMFAACLAERARVLTELERHDDAVADVERGLALVKDSPEPYPRYLLVKERGFSFLHRARFDEARAAYDEALELCKAQGDLRRTGIILIHLGLIQHWTGQFDEAEEALQGALEIAQTMRDYLTETYTGWNLALVAHVRGRFTDAERLFARSLEIAERTNKRVAAQRLIGDRGVLHISLGRYDEAKADLEVGIAGSTGAANQRYAGVFRAFRAIAGAMAGDDDDYAQHFAKARADFDESPIDAFYVGAAHVVRAARARQVMLGGDVPQAEQERDAARADFDAWLDEAPGALSHVLRALLTRFARHAEQMATPGGVLAHDDEGHYRLEGVTEVIDLSTSQAPRRVLDALIGSHLLDAEARVSVEDLFEQGWPGERAVDHAAKNRVQVAVSALRRAGLKPVIDSTRVGYRLTPALIVERRPL